MNVERVVSVVGLGYVGLPVAVAFAEKFKTIAFDINEKRISDLKEGVDHTGEVSSEELKNPKLMLTAEPADLRLANFHIVTVPTPIDDAKRPDLGFLRAATLTVAKGLKKGDVVVYESTVYPGLTEEECVPILVKESGLRYQDDFKVGYSPERINPGDKHHRFTQIKKVVAGSDSVALELIAEAYGAVVQAGVYRASSLAVAEAAKVIENTQRDLNVALINELALIFHKMGIDTHEVLEAAGTKWNFLKFTPGLVGGHCIGVDPYYLTHKAERLNYIPQVILAGRRVNDGMGRYIAREAVKLLALKGATLNQTRVTILGVTFKENCPDIRNSRVFDIVSELEEFGIQVQLTDPFANSAEVEREYRKGLTPFEALQPCDLVIVAVAHDEYRSLTAERLKRLCRGPVTVMDVKAIYDRDQLKQAGCEVWRL